MLSSTQSETKKEFDKEFSSIRRTSSTIRPFRHSPALSAGISKERKYELAVRFRLNSDQIGVYEKLVDFMKTLKDDEKSDLISELLKKSKRLG